MKQQLLNLLFESLSQFDPNITLQDVHIEVPDDSTHGDFATNSAMQLVKTLKKNPRQIAENIIAALPKNDLIEKTEIAGPGFINFFLTKKSYFKGLQALCEKKEKIGKTYDLKGKVFIAEHTDPNLFKEMHIGHVMTNTIGESLYRIFTFAGTLSKNVTFQGDVGMHIAKALWGIQNIGEDFPVTATPYEKQKFLGKCYVFGEKNFSESENIKKDIISINKKIYSREDDKLNSIYDKGSKWSLDYLESVYNILGSNFDHYFLESGTWEKGQEIVEKHIGTVFEKSDGAILFRGSEHGHHDRVFINSQGLPTYEAKDIGLFWHKWDMYNPDISVTVTGGDQDQYFKTVREAAGLINPEWKEKTAHVAHGVLKLTSGKMSSRSGDIVRAQEWIESAKESILKGIKEKETSSVEEEDIESTAQKIAIGAIKYSILKVSAGKDIVYDQEKATDATGNSGPYLQYSYVRSRSILNKVQDIKEITTPRNSDIPEFEKQLHHFEDFLAISRSSYSPHHLAGYLYNLASSFNSFYANNRILDDQNPDYLYNIQLVQVFSRIMKNGLYLLGIEAPEKM